jgi:hypothetical protein
MSKRSTNDSARCPACDTGRTIDFFAARLPVDVGRLFISEDEARRATFGKVDLCFCTSCGFVHNRSFEPDRLKFAPGYEASLIHSPLFRSFTNSVATRLIERYDTRSKTIVEIGCGKGEFLSLICRMGANTGYGFDPSLSANRIEPAGEGRVQLISDYYDERYSQITPDLLCSLSVFEDIQCPVEFLSRIRKIIGTRETKVYFEVFNGARALKGLSGWSVHYEQCNYWSLESLVAVFEKCGFALLDSGTCYADGEYLYIEAEGAEIEATISNGPGLELPEELANLSQHHDNTIASWRATLSELGNSGKRVAVWGTGGKGIGFLNAVPAHAVACVVDINPDRQHKFIPGSAHRIEAPDHLRHHKPDVIIITNPLYEDEIMAQVAGLGIECDYMVA